MCIDIVVYNPLAGGLFSGKYSTFDSAPTEGRFSNNTTSMGKMYRERYFRPSFQQALELIEPVVKKHDLTLILCKRYDEFAESSRHPSCLVLHHGRRVLNAMNAKLGQ